jgi:photosystem II stability/assembly factor-like uncharacterized protein
LSGCELAACAGTPASYEPWDVEISRHATDRLALVVGGIGGVQCGLVMASTDDGVTWHKEQHECAVLNCASNSMYSDDPATALDTWRHSSFRTLYGVAILDGDNSAVAAGYNGQHVFRNPSTGLWEDRSSFSSNPFQALNAVVFPMYGAAADAGTMASGSATLTGAGGHVRKTNPNVQSWADDRMGEPWRTADVHFRDANVGWQVGQFFRIARTMDGGHNWTPQNPPPQPGTPSLTAISFEPLGVYGVTVGEPDSRPGAYEDKPKILWTFDGGMSDWRLPDSISVVRGTDWDFKTLFDIELIGGSGPTTQFCAVGQAGLIFRTDDGGRNWRQVVDPSVPLVNLQAHDLMGVAFHDPDHGVIVGKKSGGGARAYAYTRSGLTETLADITPADLSITQLADVQVLGATAYAVGERDIGGVRSGVVVSASFGGSSFGQFSALPSQPAFPACSVGGALGVNPVLVEIAVNTANGDIWVGGECGRVWHYSSANGWVERKSQTDGHVRGLSLTAAGNLFLSSFRASETQQAMTVW